MNLIHENKVAKLKEKINATFAAASQQKTFNNMTMETRQQHLQSTFDSKSEEFNVNIGKLKEKHDHARKVEQMRFEQIVSSHKEMIQSCKLETDNIIKRYADEEEKLKDESEEKIDLEVQKYNTLLKERDDLTSKNQKIINAMEDDADEEMISESKGFQVIAQQEKRVATRLKGENDITKKKYDVLMKDFEEHKETIISLKEKQSEISDNLVNLQGEKSNREQELKQIDRRIVKVDKEINKATVETHKMEKYVR